MPTLVATPWPSGPVVVSTPDVQRYSGWPGQRLSSWRKVLMSSSGTDDFAERFVLLVDGLSPRSGAAANRAASTHARSRARSGRGWARRDLAGRSAGIAATGSRPPAPCAMGVPGCPELAACTASMDSVRMVLMLRRSRFCSAFGWLTFTPVAGDSNARRVWSGFRCAARLHGRKGFYAKSGLHAELLRFSRGQREIPERYSTGMRKRV